MLMSSLSAKKNYINQDVNTEDEIQRPQRVAGGLFLKEQKVWKMQRCLGLEQCGFLEGVLLHLGSQYDLGENENSFQRGNLPYIITATYAAHHFHVPLERLQVFISFLSTESCIVSLTLEQISCQFG